MSHLYLLAGSNGAGKTTLYERVIGPTTGLPFVNADKIASALAGGEPITEALSLEAAQLAAQRRSDLIDQGRSFVAETVTYSPGLSLGTDSAVTTLATGQGVCRDYAHLVIALLRAMDLPARYVACYAPGLVPMDFHAVAEAWIDGRWLVVDATRLSNRRGLVRIATGRDAADCAFLSYYGANLALRRLVVDARVDADDAVAAAASDPQQDDRAALVSIG